MAKANKGSAVATATPSENDGNVTVNGNRRNVEVKQIMDEINSQPDEVKEPDEFDHRSDEEKNAEGFREIIKEWKGEKKDEQEADDVDADADIDDKPDDDSSESKDEPEVKTETEKAADDETPVIPKVLVDKALDLGVTSDEIQKVKSIDDLTKIIDALNMVQPKAEEEKKEEPEVDPLDEITLDPDEYEEDLVEKFNKLKDIVKDTREKNKELEEKEKARERMLIEENTAMIVGQFDSTLDEVNDELFGKSEELQPKTEAYENRSKLWDEVKRIGMALPDASLKEAIEIAGKKLFGDSFDKKAAKDAEVSKKLKERSQSIVGKPSQREAIDDEPKEGKEAAISAVGKMLREIGIKK